MNMNAKLKKTITMKDGEDIDDIISEVMSKENYANYKIGSLYTKFKNGNIVHGYDVYFYDNDGNVVDIITFKFE